MGSVMVVRLLVDFFISFYQNSISEFYPISISAIGIGMGGVWGSIGVGLSEVLVTSLVEEGVNIFITLAITFMILLILYYFMPETLGKEKKDHIEEVKEEKNKTE